MCAKLTFLARCKKRAGLIGPEKKDRDLGLGGGGGGGGGGQYLRKGDNICQRIMSVGDNSASRLCPGGQNLRGGQNLLRQRFE